MEKIDLISEFKNLDANNKFKRYRELWQDAAAYKILTSYPLHIDIELSGVCNLKCESCFQNGLIEGPLGFMDIDLFKKIIDDGVPKGLCAIKLQIRGESFLHPRIFDCIDYAKRKGILDIQITTNGTLLNPDIINKVLHSGLDAIIFSVDSHHATSFSQKKETNSYTSTEETIIELLKQREKTGGKKPWVRLQSSIPDSDIKSYKSAKAYLKDRFPQADIFVISRIFDFRYDHDAYPDLHENYILDPCTYLMHRLSIFWNGEVTTCCSDYNNLFKLGNFPDTMIEDIWNSKKLEAFRDCHKTGKRIHMKICRHCQAAVSLKNEKGLALDKTKCHISDYKNK